MLYTDDVENRLISASNGSSVDATYEYDPLGRRSKKSGTGTATEVYLSDGVEEIADYDGAGAMLRRYVHGPGVDEPIVMYTGSSTGTKSYYHANWQGSVVAMTNSGGTATDTYVYSPYGKWTTPPATRSAIPDAASMRRRGSIITGPECTHRYWVGFYRLIRSDMEMA